MWAIQDLDPRVIRSSLRTQQGKGEGKAKGRRKMVRSRVGGRQKTNGTVRVFEVWVEMWVEHTHTQSQHDKHTPQ